jgi:hypothetical protein
VWLQIVCRHIYVMRMLRRIYFNINVCIFKPINMHLAIIVT